MIRHLVFFSAKSPTHVEDIVQGLRVLGTIPGVVDFAVAKNAKADPWSSEVDVVVHARFADHAALEAFKAHPVYADCVRIVRPLRELRFVADYDEADALGPAAKGRSSDQNSVA